MKSLLKFIAPRKFDKMEEHYNNVEKSINKMKSANEQIADTLIKKNEQLQQTIAENHFTIRIHKATRGTK